MRADLFSRTFSTGRLAGLALVALAAAGCKTEKDPDDPTLLGAPPTTAYIGVEYYYNWGAYGGEGILDYSLTNAPAWLALEDTSNKARQGVIMRGVPGLTGGNRGLDDIGKTENIDIVTTDGRLAGFQPFDIEVKHNLVTVEAPEFTEGESPDISAPRGEHCALPDLEPEGAHSLGNDGAQPTRRVYAKVKLERPSVTRVSIAFQLESDFVCDDPVVDSSSACHSEDSNMGRAIIGQDIVALGGASHHPVDEGGNELTYVTYQQLGGMYDRGVVTLEPGITECYIPLEVIDDKVAERTEQARLALTEVRTGLASLGNNNAGISTTLTIADNEPVVALRTLDGGTRDTLNVEADVFDLTGFTFNEDQVYTAILTGEREGQVNVKLAVSERGSTVGAGDFLIVQESEPLEGLDLDPPQGDNELVFPVGTNEVLFSVTAKDYTDTEDSLDDRTAILVVDEKAQAGLENYARGESNELMTLSFNRQTSPLTWTDGFVPTDMAMGSQGELYVAGRTAKNELEVRIYNQQGGQIGTARSLDGGAPVSGTDVYLALGSRTERVDGSSTTYEELVAAYSEDGDVVIELYQKDKDSASYVPAFDGDNRFLTGSSGNDSVKWVGYQGSNGNLIVAGESAGTWEGQSSSGGVDTFLAVIETTGAAFNLKEVRQVGSSGNDRVAGGSSQSATPMLFGYAPNVVDGNGAVGPFFYSGTAAGGVNGIGGDASDQLRHGLFANSTAWLIGDSPWNYRITEVEEGDNQLERSSGAGAGFVLGFTSTGIPRAAFTIPSVEGIAVGSLDKGVALGSDVIAAGTLAGGQGLLARLTTQEDPELYQSWQKALEPGVQFLGLGNYRDDEIVALVYSDVGHQVLLFSPEGRLLTAPADNP